MIEVWRKIPHYLDYEVSSLGRVKRIKFGKENILKQTLISGGYLSIGLYADKKRHTKKVHQLVAIAFLGHTPNGMDMVVDHINGNKTDNSLYNLQVITNRENSSKDKKGGTSRYVGVSLVKSNGKWVSRIQINGNQVMLGRFKEEYTASIAYQTTLHKLKKNVIKSN